jgi:two-component system sensor histidine kinase HydH
MKIGSKTLCRAQAHHELQPRAELSANAKLHYDARSPAYVRRDMVNSSAQAGPSFKLLRWFSIASLVLVAAFAAGNAMLISSFLSKHLLEREAQVTRDFTQNVLQADESMDFLLDPSNATLAERFRGSIAHFTAMPDVLRMNVYSTNGTVLWSTDKSIVGRRFSHNHELDEALRGDLVVESGRITAEVRRKPEHVGLPADSEFFIETYVPVKRLKDGSTVGVVEIYKAPVALTAAIRAGHRQVWAAAGIGALILYVTLFWIVHRADRTIHRQQERLVDAETMAAAGELTSSMAHNIRNPLASIRSSAELWIDLEGEGRGEQARDIIRGVDRIEAWIRELLRFTRAEPQTSGAVDIGSIVVSEFEERARDFQQRGIAGTASVLTGQSRVLGDAVVYAQVLHSVISNAIDATPAGGRVTGTVERASQDRIRISIADTGQGIPTDLIDTVFKPFFTTKKEGLGLGLALAKRTVERIGGNIRIQSAVGTGTTVVLELPSV